MGIFAKIQANFDAKNDANLLYFGHKIKRFTTRFGLISCSIYKNWIKKRLVLGFKKLLLGTV